MKTNQQTYRNQTHQTKPNDSCGHMMSNINSNVIQGFYFSPRYILFCNRQNILTQNK